MAVPEETSPVLLFDSGVGGLTVLDRLRERLPDAPVIYAADTAGLPYGAKSEAEIAARVAGLLGRMAERYAPRLICIACNTASTIALGMVRDVLEIPIVGTVPAIKPAAAMTRTGTFAVLGTEATVRQGYVDRLEAQFAAGKRMLRHGANGLVPLAEAKLRGKAVSVDAVRSELAGLIEQPGADRIDTLVLACTHFPLLEAEIAEALGRDVAFVHGAEGIARRIEDLTRGQAFARSVPDFAVSTGDLAKFRELAAAFAERGIEQLRAF